MVRLTDILQKVQSYHTGANLDLINRAYVYAARMHDGQMRKSGDPYLIHPVGVADLIAEMKLDTSSVCAALLHDVAEDTEATIDDIRERFGNEVAFLVDGVTKLGRVDFTCREDRQAESFRKMLVAMARDIRVLVVKLADRLDNMRTLDAMSEDSRERIALETRDIYAPLAGRLGIYWMKSELEDLAFQNIHPDAFNEIRRKYQRSARERQKYIVDVTRRLKRLFAEHNTNADVSGRVKHAFSVYRKMQQQQCEFEQVYDLLAFRVIVDSITDCYGALGAVHSQWTPIPGRFKDYIALPKPNNYQSLHTTVIGPGRERIEIQIRTKDMHRVAEYGIAAHWSYKETGSGPGNEDADRFTWLRQLMEFQRDVEDPAEFLDSVKVDLFADEVYVFTPAGDVKVFPRGATPVDLAFDIHTDVGHHCGGARVNGSIVPLRYKLRNGDTVEILTHANQHPNKDWLDFAVTGRARSKIRNYLRTERRKRSIQLGKDLLERALLDQNVSANRFTKSGLLDKALEQQKASSPEDLYARIGVGKLRPKGVVDDVLEEKNGNKDSAELRPSLVERAVRRVTRRDSKPGIRIDDIDDVLVRFAKCCAPVPGDAVTGWITRGRGVTVHRRECAKAMELDPERRVEVGWDSNAKMDRPVSLRVVTADQPGILANVSSAFTESGINISEANCRASVDGRAVNTFQFTVSDVSKLRGLMRNIAKVKGVYHVERV